MAADDIIAALDIGTSKVCVLVGEITETEGIEIIGVGVSPCRGIKKGVVVNLEETIKSIEAALEEAERMANVEIDSVYVGISGAHISSTNSRGVIAISGADREITDEDVERVIEAAKTITLNQNREVIHVLSREFIVDEQGGIKDPVGMSGIRLEAEVHVITGAETAVQNIIKSVQRAGLHISDIVLSSLASSEAVLTKDEKELGVVMVDIGAGTTDISVFNDGSICYSSVLPLGGNHVSNDIAVGLKTSITSAEKLKKEHGCALAGLVNDKDMIEITTPIGDRVRSLPCRALCEIIEPRMEEILKFIKEEIRKSGSPESPPGGVVLTGGAARLKGLDKQANEIFDCPVRIGYPVEVNGLKDKVSSPEYSTALGLLKYGLKIELSGGKWKRPGFLSSFVSGIKQFFKNLF